MKQFIFMAFVGVALFSATMVFAQTTVAQPVPTYVSQSCPSYLTLNLYRGLSDYTTGGQVTALQQILVARGYNQLVTGYFGVMTAANVAAFQRDQNIYPVTGGVGPLTRAAIARLCNGGGVTTTFSASPTTGTAPLAVHFAVGELPANSNMAAMYVDFGDNQQANAQTIYCFRAPCIPSMTADHTYTASGTYTAKLMQNNNYCAPGMYCTLVYREPTQLGSVKVTVYGSVSTNTTFSASPTSGAAPLTVSFSTNNSGQGGRQNVIDFGDGQYEIAANCYAPADACVSPGVNTHTYSARGTYTATLSPYIACMYTNPRCMIATMPLGSVTVTAY